MEFSEVDSSAVIVFILEILVQQVDSEACTKVCRPAILRRRERQPVNQLRVEREHCCDFTQSKFNIGTEKNVRPEKWPYLRLYSQQHEFGIERNAPTHSNLVPSGLTFDI